MSMHDITGILEAIDRGDSDAVDKLLPLVYDELRRMAARHLSGEVPGHTLDATSLVNEVYLRLFGSEHAPHWDNRGHFFASAAEAMRRILVDSARRKKRQKRGGGRRRVELKDDMIAGDTSIDELLAVDDALEHLARTDARAAELVKLRCFSGLSTEEAAKVLGMSPRSGFRKWLFGQAWLYRHIHGRDRSPADGESPTE
jgi:RNA polymerase sigma factor (TIGR02999 family)